jgi:hypothetical protein
MLEFFVLVHLVQREVATKGIALVVMVGEMAGESWSRWWKYREMPGLVGV